LSRKFLFSAAVKVVSRILQYSFGTAQCFFAAVTTISDKMTVQIVEMLGEKTIDFQMCDQQ
jgi:hypothetical protein